MRNKLRSAVLGFGMVVGTPAVADDISDAVRIAQYTSYNSRSQCRTYDQSHHCLGLHYQNVMAHFRLANVVARRIGEVSPQSLNNRDRAYLNDMYAACSGLPEPTTYSRALRLEDCDAKHRRVSIKLDRVARRLGIIK